MTIMHVYHDPDASDVTLSVDRNYLEETVTITIDRYGDKSSMTLPTSDFSELVRHVGFTP